MIRSESACGSRLRASDKTPVTQEQVRRSAIQGCQTGEGGSTPPSRSTALDEMYRAADDVFVERWPDLESRTIESLSTRERLALPPDDGFPAPRQAALTRLTGGLLIYTSGPSLKVTRLSLVDDFVVTWFLACAAALVAVVALVLLRLSHRRRGTIVTAIAVGVALTAFFSLPARAATFAERDAFIAEYIADHTDFDQDVDGFGHAGAGELRVSDGFAHEPVLIREALVAFVDRHGYPKPPPPPEPTYTQASFSAPVSGIADWQAIAECEGWGDWSLVYANGHYFVLQFARSTWLAYGGTQAELDAGVAPSPARLIEVAENVLADQGPGAWPGCFEWAD